MARDEREPVLMHYARRGGVVRFQTKNVDEHELRALAVALWLLLEPTSRRDFIHELAHYHEAPGSRAPAVSSAIADAYRKAQS